MQKIFCVLDCAILVALGALLGELIASPVYLVAFVALSAAGVGVAVMRSVLGERKLESSETLTDSICMDRPEIKPIRRGRMHPQAAKPDAERAEIVERVVKGEPVEGPETADFDF